LLTGGLNRRLIESNLKRTLLCVIQFTRVIIFLDPTAEPSRQPFPDKKT
jgi:hypothetical protein